jgi:CBS domain containing-hemolysin-like protein
MTALILYATLAIAVSFLCSLLEASLLSLPRSHAESLAAQGSATGRSLRRLKDRIDRPLAAILTLNTVAHTVGAAGVGAQAAKVFGSASVGLASAIMTLAILVVSEVIPKTLGAIHARRLAPVTSVLTTAMLVVCYPVVVVLEQLNRWIGFGRQTRRLSRMEVLATIRLGAKAGSLADREYRIATNALALNEIRLSQVMTPRTVVFGLPRSMTVRQALDEHHPIRFARIPIHDRSLDEVLGYLPRYDLHVAMAEGREDAQLGELARTIIVLPEQALVGQALERMLGEHEHIALIVDEYGGMAGIVTLEDLLETLLGQHIIDETDPTSDMRDLARRQAPEIGDPPD